MSLPRICSLGRALVSRGPSTRLASRVFLSTRTPIPYRPFVSISRHLQEATQTDAASPSNPTAPASQAPVPEEQRRKNARSVKLLKVPRRAEKRKVEAMFRDAGFDVADIYVGLDRFRIEGDTHASVELADEQQAQKAVEMLNGSEALGHPVYLRILSPEFDWNVSSDVPYTHFVREDEAGIRTAVQPILERRRVRISAKSPAWGKAGDPPSQRRVTDQAAIIRAFGPFGIESISRLSPQWGHKTFNPKFLCHIDFTTTEGASEAMSTFHDKEFEGVMLWTRYTEIDPAKAYQIGRVHKGILKELQAKGAAPQDSEIDEDLVSKRERKALAFDKQRNAPQNKAGS